MSSRNRMTLRLSTHTVSDGKGTPGWATDAWCAVAIQGAFPRHWYRSLDIQAAMLEERL